MKEEYIVISKTAIQKRIEELENYTYATQNIYLEGRNEGELSCLLNLLSQSTPLIPEIEKAFDEARKLKTFNLEDVPLDVKLGYEVEKEEYITNLKLDI